MNIFKGEPVFITHGNFIGYKTEADNYHKQPFISLVLDRLA
jgi:hypothetical protein